MIGISSQIRKYMSLLSEENRFKDIAVQFVEVKKVGDIVETTGRQSRVYGGKCDLWTCEYVREADEVHKYKVSAKQLELIVDECPRIEVNGGRGSAKSYAGCLWVLKKLIEKCGNKCQIAGSEHKVTKQDWDKMLSLIPYAFFLPGREGIKRSDKEMHMINGSMIRYVSCKNIGSLRSWGGHCCLADEEQDIKQEALDVIWPSLRLAIEPQLVTAGTPKRGEYAIRHKKNLEEQALGEPFSCHRFESYDNIFVPRRTFDLAKKQMDKLTYEREILASWDSLDDGEPIVFRSFSRDRHCVDGVQGLSDITTSYVARKLRIGRQYIVGVDPNYDYPNYAVVFKVFRPNIWVAIDVVSSLGHCGDLAKALIDRGYKNSVIISDASGRYNKGPKSSDRLMRAHGFTVTHDYVNPFVTDSVDAVLLKLDPVIGDISLRIKLPECVELAEAMESLLWHKSGSKFDKQIGVDHVVDAMRYPISFFEPVSSKKIKKVKS